MDLGVGSKTGSYFENGCFCSCYKEPRQECLINMHGQHGFKSKWQGCFHFVYQPDDCLECCEVIAERTILGFGFWLFSSCCPLQGGSNLQPTNEPSSTLTLCFELNPRETFLSPVGLWASQWHYQLDEVTALLTVAPARILECHVHGSPPGACW